MWKLLWTMLISSFRLDGDRKTLWSIFSYDKRGHVLKCHDTKTIIALAHFLYPRPEQLPKSARYPRLFTGPRWPIE
jgi:hypothetical protein